MSEWIEYTGSDEQIREITHNECALMLTSGKVRLKSYFFVYDLEDVLKVITHYLIAEPHPYADLIKIWADTGCPVWYKHKHIDASGECGSFHPQFLNPDHYEYRLTPFED